MDYALNTFASAVAHRRELPSVQRKLSLTERAVRQHAGGTPNILNRVTDTQSTVPSASAFQFSGFSMGAANRLADGLSQHITQSRARIDAVLQGGEA